MDFVLFMTVYLIVFGIIVILYYYADSTVFQNKLLKLLKHLLEVLLGLVPPILKNLVTGAIDRMFYRRNHILQVVYTGLVVAGHVVLVVDILPIVYTFAAHENHVLLPMVLVLLNSLFFSLTCTTDPGEITHRTQRHYQSAYAYDDVLYKEGVKCRTCVIPKLPRSKHCSVCDRCVYRFDHHCIWTNNCIGGLNHMYFILFLVSIVVMSVNGVAICWRTLALVVNHFNMLETNYIDPSGNVQPITLKILAQHLFLNFPRIVFTMVSLTFVAFALGGFALYHIFLVATNQTTNERYKRNGDWLQFKEDKAHSCTSNDGTSSTSSRSPRKNVFDKGFCQNIYEVLCPHKFLRSTIKKK
ncbi:palmitoyltransferase ZDHHC4-like [Liolophura sinensis]|uniref:palmitoyltransferase ZDHHC4-like n=1 Tax=Liolophura sinensis TaxID=3198878 RepID=UPI003158121B